MLYNPGLGQGHDVKKDIPMLMRLTNDTFVALRKAGVVFKKPKCYKNPLIIKCSDVHFFRQQKEDSNPRIRDFQDE